MSKQKNTRVLPIVLISAIILASAVTWSMLRRQPAVETNVSELSLNDIIKRGAGRWEPVYQSWFGKMSPDFTLTDTAGKEHTLSDYRGKDVMLVFWATWCPPCQKEIPHLIELRNIFSEDKLAILAISNETPALVKKFAAQKKLNYTLLLEEGNMPNPFGITKIFQSTGIPCSFFIDAEGKIKLATSGLLNLNEMKAILQAKQP